MRLGSHPVGGVLHLKHYEGMLKYGRPTRPKSVMAEVGHHTKIDSFTKEKKKYVVSEWEDVEDWGVMIINFEDGSKATVFASDTVLGGVRNVLNVYLSNAVVYVNINPHDVLEVYAPEPHIFGEEYIAEKLETKAGWNFPSPDDDWMKGFPQELEDFIDAILFGQGACFRNRFGKGCGGGDLRSLCLRRKRDANRVQKIIYLEKERNHVCTMS